MKTILKYIILSLVELIEKWEYRNFSLDENDINKKIIDTININNLKIETPQGFKPITSIHKTQPYTLWRIETESGLYLEGADNHILIDSLGNEIFIKNLKLNYYIQTKNGLDKIIKIKKLPFKVSMYDVTVDSKEHTFYSNDIVSHNTTTIAAFFAWYLCFHTDRNLAILANKQDTAFEIVAKVKDVFRGLPFFLKPGIISVLSGGMVLDNGCKLLSQATTKTAQIGYTIHVLYADEFAHIQDNIADDFYRSVYPTLASSDISQCIISSTPNGENLFFEIWDKAQKGNNSFLPIRVDWWEVPGRDDDWAENMKRDFGEERFAQEYGLDFNRGGSNLLLSGHDLTFLKKVEKQYVFHELAHSKLDESLYRNLLWHPDFDPNAKFDSKHHRFVISIDTGEGKHEDEIKDNDYNICNVFLVEPKSIPQLKKLRKDELKIENMFRMFQVGLYRDNIKDEEICAKVAQSIIFEQLGGNLCKTLIEMNFNGKFFLDKFSKHEDFDDSTVLHTFHTKPIMGEKLPPRKPGFKVTGGDKDFFCKIAKGMFSKRILVISEHETLKEFKSFGRNKKGRWAGLGIHDDIAMSTINTSRLYNESEYGDWLYDFLDEMEESPIKLLMSRLLDQFVETSEISDEEFDSMYKEEQTVFSEATLFKMLNSQDGIRYTPSSTFGKGGFDFPWKNS